jgi:hypothetical protein
MVYIDLEIQLVETKKMGRENLSSWDNLNNKPKSWWNIQSSNIVAYANAIPSSEQIKQ